MYKKLGDISSDSQMLDLLKSMKEKSLIKNVEGPLLKGKSVPTTDDTIPIYKKPDGTEYVMQGDVGVTVDERRRRFIDQVEKYHLGRHLPESRYGSTTKLNRWECLGDRTIKDLKIELIGHKSFVLCGPAGTGKTTMAVRLADYIQKEEDWNVQVRRWNDWLSEMRDFFRSKSDESYYTHIQKAGDADLLLIDELADTKKQSATQWESQVLFDVVSGRYGNAKPIIFTTNLDKDQIAHIYGDPVASRIYSRERGVILNFESEARYR